MNATYLRDHQIRPIEQWTGDQHLDWLHPCHGPLPHKIGATRYNGDEYCVCLWLLEERIVTVTELVEVYDVTEGWGNRSDKKGWIVNSLNWRPTEDGFMCEDRHVVVPDALRHHTDREQEDNLYRQIMLESVEITVRTPLGAPTNYLHNHMKGYAWLSRKLPSTKK